MKWYKRFGVQIGIVSAFALVLGFSLFIVFRSQDVFGSLSDAVSAAISTLGALSVGGVAVIQLRKHKIYENQAELDHEVKLKQLDAMEQDRIVKQKQLDAMYGERLATAIEHLKDDSLPIRMGALFELKWLGLDSPIEQDKIVRILSSFIMEHIQSARIIETGYFIPSPLEDYAYRPNQDVFIAREIISQFFEENSHHASLDYLNADGLDLHSIQLKGADLQHANLQGTWLRESNLIAAMLQDANLEGANLYGAFLNKASLSCANLREVDLRFAFLEGADIGKAHIGDEGVRFANLEDACLAATFLHEANLMATENLTAEQLLYAGVDDTTVLGSPLRAEYERLKAEQDAS